MLKTYLDVNTEIIREAVSFAAAMSVMLRSTLVLVCAFSSADFAEIVEGETFGFLMKPCSKFAMEGLVDGIRID